MTEPEDNSTVSPSREAEQPCWCPDPWGRHERRWWDGETWTEHVGDRGVPAIDPVPASAGP